MTSDFDRLKSALADRYAIEREIGAGGMATVYLAQDVKHRRKVAVKVLRPEIASALGAERFVREIEIAANLSHPLILPLHDSGDADGNLFYVMPYVDGESLRERLDRAMDIARSHPGPVALRVLLRNGGEEPSVLRSRKVNVAPAPNVLEELRDVLGKERVRLVEVNG